MINYICVNCNNIFSPKAVNQKFCPVCQKQRYKYQPKPKPPERNCIKCGKPFQPKNYKQTYCHNPCEPVYLPVKREPIALKPKECSVCGKIFLPKNPQQVYCSPNCTKIKNAHVKKGPYREKSNCIVCKKEFIKKVSTSTTCSQECYKTLKKREKDSKKEKPLCFNSFSDLWFNNEEQFSKWFHDNFSLFGLEKLLKHDRLFPDVIAMPFSKNLGEIYIELEYLSSNFSKHDHYSPFCDLIISFVKPFNQTNVKGIPVWSIFNCHLKNDQIDRESMELTPYFTQLIASGQNYLNKVIAKMTETVAT